MTALSFDAPLRFLGPVYTEKLPLSLDVYPISIWKGAPVIIDQSADDAGVVPADGVTLTTGDVFVGIAAEHAVSVLGQEEATEMEVYVWPTIVGFPNSALDLGDLGKVISMSDSGTLAAGTGAYPAIGTLYTVREGYAYVLLYPPTVK
jgi:hypothetical protein